MVVNKKIIIFMIIATINYSCNNKCSTEKSSCNRMLNKTTKPIVHKNLDTIDFYKIDLKEIFKEDISFDKNDSTIVFIFNKCNGRLQYRKGRNELVLGFYPNCSSYILDIPKSFKLVKKSRWLEETLTHKDYYYMKTNYIIIYNFGNYDKFYKEYYYSCPEVDKNTDFLMSIRIYTKKGYFDYSKGKSSASYILKPNDTLIN